jgi:DNA repair protein RadC
MKTDTGDINHDQGFELRRAVIAGDVAKIKTLLAAGAQVDVLQNAPVRWAVRHRQASAASLLLEHGASIDTHEEEFVLLAAYRVECFQLAMLDTRRRLIRLVIISQGTLDTLLVHPREVFRHAIILSASAVILIHNHPTSDPTPSQADIAVTRDLIRAGQLMKIEVLDHVILGGKTTERPKDYVSLRELGYFHS